MYSHNYTATVCILLAVFCLSSHNLPKSEYSSTNDQPNLVLEIRCAKKKIKIGEEKPGVIEAFIINKQKKPVNVVQPGDGSFSNNVTPRVLWSIRLIESKMPRTQDDYDYFKHPDGFPIKFNGFLGCGTLSPIKRSDIVHLQPNKEIKLTRTGQPSNPLSDRVGKYGIKLYYEHLPDFEWRYGRPTSDVMEIIRTKTPKLQLESNELIFEVVE